MVKPTVPELDALVFKDLLEGLKEKIQHTEACLFHGIRLLQELAEEGNKDLDLSEQIREVRTFVWTGYHDIQEVKKLYQSLKDEIYKTCSPLPSPEKEKEPSLFDFWDQASDDKGEGPSEFVTTFDVWLQESEEEDTQEEMSEDLPLTTLRTSS